MDPEGDGVTNETYSPGTKIQRAGKIAAPYNMTVTAVAQMEGISEATLYNWRNQAKTEGKPVPGAEKNSELRSRPPGRVRCGPGTSRGYLQWCEAVGIICIWWRMCSAVKSPEQKSTKARVVS